MLEMNNGQKGIHTSFFLHKAEYHNHVGTALGMYANPMHQNHVGICMETI